MSVRSSSLSSLQQIPSARVLRAHFARRGVVTPGSAWSIGQTGGFEGLEAVSGRGGRGTIVETGDAELSKADMVVEKDKE